MKTKGKRLLACLMVSALFACAEADIDFGKDPSLSGSVSIEEGTDGKKQPTILPGPDHQEGLPTDEITDDGVVGGNDVLPPENPGEPGLTPNFESLY